VYQNLENGKRYKAGLEIWKNVFIVSLFDTRIQIYYHFVIVTFSPLKPLWI